MFCNRINEIIGKDMTKLFNVNGIELRKSEVFFNNQKGVKCNYNNASVNWPVGRIVLNSILNVVLS